MVLLEGLVVGHVQVVVHDLVVVELTHQLPFQCLLLHLVFFCVEVQLVLVAVSDLVVLEVQSSPCATT